MNDYSSGTPAKRLRAARKLIKKGFPLKVVAREVNIPRKLLKKSLRSGGKID